MGNLADRNEEGSSPTKWQFPLILGIMVLLAVGNIYFYWDTNQLERRLGHLESSVQSDFLSMRESSEASAAVTAKTIEALRLLMDDERSQALRAANQATTNATRHADELARKIESEQRKAREQVVSAIGEVKEATSTANAKAADAINRVGTVDTQVTRARSDLDRTIAELKSVQGDLGVQSGLVATNAKELTALRELGERNYVEFDLRRSSEPQRVGGINVVLRKTDPKRNRYTLDVIADDKRVEKKDRYINEPVQFYVSRARQPYEIVVNEVRKDQIVGYLAVPKMLSAAR